MNNGKTSLVITSIAAPNDVMKSIAAGCAEHKIDFIVIGDVPSPADFVLNGCSFFSLARQAETGLKTADAVPKRHYARKNIGYLLAMQSGAQIMLETDDDNFPLDTFWEERVRQQTIPVAEKAGWLNVYRYFSDSHIWPRGLPLDAVNDDMAEFEALAPAMVDCPIQQGLADENPDVDAIYRLLLPLPLDFRKDRRIALGAGCWCPFNSQNTTWFREAFPLLYLPAYCSFRMTDIWRSFVAQRIAWECGWHLLFHEPTVYQKRNDHSLMKDFEDEVPGYLQNRKIGSILENVVLRPGVGNMPSNLYACYEALVSKGIFESKELALVEAWITDLEAVTEP
jgi:hypothetical protein